MRGLPERQRLRVSLVMSSFEMAMPVVGLLACTFPLMNLGSLLGGLDPGAFGLAFMVARAVAVRSCALVRTI